MSHFIAIKSIADKNNQMISSQNSAVLSIVNLKNRVNIEFIFTSQPIFKKNNLYLGVK